MPHQPPVVALIGRANVGKSSIFNRLLETQKALVSDVAGTTRDRNEGDCLWRGRIIRLVDTGGMDINTKDDMELNILKQAEFAIARADILLFVLDAKTGAMPQERALADHIRESGKPVIVVANKAEKVAERLSVSNREWQFPGLPEPLPVSAARGSGLGDLLDQVYEKLEALGKPAVDPFETDAIKVAVIGKPNVGKSTLLNAILGEERFITSPISHTTREPNDMLITLNDKRYLFIDTAGMRKQGKVKKAGGLEEAAVRRNEHIVKMADVTILVMDASQPIGNQEKTLAGFLKDSGSAVIIVANKWDLIEDKNTTTMNRYREYFAGTLPFLNWAPVMFLSALTKQRVNTLFAEIDRVYANRAIEIPNKDLAEFLTEAQTRHKPMIGKGKTVPKLLGFKQMKSEPPRFDLILKARRTDALSVAYIRFLENRLREKFNLTGTPLRINIRIARAVSK
ncbi:ribosome biogenesis GTPase Der [Candidatus Uhrbacteria bacterium CG10_big_fil_rev_8_21_14_0_10_48_16]|uniref:GTPase Der n=1 Tax=Candidatus Uhrbacteria bacterium CG10_big_fil_rev_8_21_14_0_10_48_16 TaxID=1975038 RepID=A0A2M8LH00_9BACT|nr:MAG: ribosome biogenesis GTPase Der [Candidatus Uhrbacteria bacterium CG10_big_fil_rev_8_21_14_0_10_48_16]